MKNWPEPWWMRESAFSPTFHRIIALCYEFDSVGLTLSEDKYWEYEKRRHDIDLLEYEHYRATFPDTESPTPLDPSKDNRANDAIDAILAELRKQPQIKNQAPGTFEKPRKPSRAQVVWEPDRVIMSQPGETPAKITIYGEIYSMFAINMTREICRSFAQTGRGFQLQWKHRIIGTRRFSSAQLADPQWMETIPGATAELRSNIWLDVLRSFGTKFATEYLRYWLHDPQNMIGIIGVSEDKCPNVAREKFLVDLGVDPDEFHARWHSASHLQELFQRDRNEWQTHREDTVPLCIKDGQLFTVP